VQEQRRVTSEGHECRFPGCTILTRGGKPYCPDHFDLNPHAAKVLEGIRERAKERKKGRPGPLTTEDVLVALLERDGCASERRLARDLRLKPKVVVAALRLLARAGYVRLGVTNRGRVVAQLPGRKSSKRGQHG
jgi:hypothetical protein